MTSGLGAGPYLKDSGEDALIAVDALTVDAGERSHTPACAAKPLGICSSHYLWMRAEPSGCGRPLRSAGFKAVSFPVF
jgi:hypothetical protein